MNDKDTKLLWEAYTIAGERGGQTMTATPGGDDPGGPGDRTKALIMIVVNLLRTEKSIDKVLMILDMKYRVQLRRVDVEAIARKYAPNVVLTDNLTVAQDQERDLSALTEDELENERIININLQRDTVLAPLLETKEALESKSNSQIQQNIRDKIENYISFEIHSINGKQNDIKRIFFIF